MGSGERLPVRIGRRLSAAANPTPPRLGLGRLKPPPRAGIKLARMLAALSAALIVTAAAVYFFIYREGDAAQRNADNLMAQYIKAQSTFQPVPSVALPTAQQSAPSETAAVYVQPDAPEVDPAKALVSVPGYDVIGVLEIDTIGLKLPVISKTTDKALKVSVCWYGGALPGEEGNMVITGHNYANGAHFGRLDELRASDALTFTTPDGTTYTYHVYALETIAPDNAEALDKTSGEFALTLLTCKSAGNQRLVVRCRLAQ